MSTPSSEAIRRANGEALTRPVPLPFAAADDPAGDTVGGTAPEEALATGGGGGSPAAAGPAAGAPSGSPAGAPSVEEASETQAPGTAAAQDLAQVIRIWPLVLDKLAEKAPALAATFDGARPVAFDDEGLAIGFAPDQPFNKRKAESPDRRQVLVEAFEAVTGEGVAPRYVLLEEDDIAAAAPPPEAEAQGGEAIDEDALMNRLMSEFDAKEVN
jgi:hypothetical protein